MKPLIALLMACAALAVGPPQSQKKGPADQPPKAAIIFIELGSVKCIPCRQMQPVMKAIEGKYADQIKIVFYDIMKEDQRRYAQEYSIRVIPTQVFLDQSGRELMRHEGFFPEKDIDAFLQSKGLKPKPAAKG